MKLDKIEEGDKVTVRFSSGNTFDGIVKYTPCATGDSWHIQEVDFAGVQKDVLHYVQTFEEIIRYP
jgi:hypothetical protein